MKKNRKGRKAFRNERKDFVVLSRALRILCAHCVLKNQYPPQSQSLSQPSKYVKHLHLTVSQKIPIFATAQPNQTPC